MWSEQESKCSADSGEHKQSTDDRSTIGWKPLVQDGSSSDPDADQDTLWDTKKSGMKGTALSVLVQVTASSYESTHSKPRPLITRVLKFEIPPLGILPTNPNKKNVHDL
jgi:hypothetical protein